MAVKPEKKKRKHLHANLGKGDVFPPCDELFSRSLCFIFLVPLANGVRNPQAIHINADKTVRLTNKMHHANCKICTHPTGSLQQRS